MDLILGGAYQGKRAYAVGKYALADGQVFTCADDAEPDWNARCVEHLERYVWYCVRNGRTPEDRFGEEAVLLCDDIFCGVVPMDVTERAWREETGRYLSRLSARAKHVTRLFCGLPLELK